MIVFRGNNRLLKFTVKAAYRLGVAGRGSLSEYRKVMVHFKTFESRINNINYNCIIVQNINLNALICYQIYNYLVLFKQIVTEVKFNLLEVSLSRWRLVKKVKVKQSRYRPGVAQSVLLRFLDYITTAQDGDKVVSPTHRPPLPPGNARGTHFCYRLSRPQGHSAIGKIMSMKN